MTPPPLTPPKDPFKLAQVGKKFAALPSMRWAARTYGVRLGRQYRQMAALALPPHLMSPDDYLRYALFRPGLSWAEKTAFLSGYAGSNLNYRLSPRKTWMQVVLGHKHRTLWMLRGAGVPVPPVLALSTADGPLPGSRYLADAAAMAAWLRAPGTLPVFGKPFGGTYSIGGAMILALEGEALVLGDGNRISPEGFAAAVFRHFPAGYLFQPVLKMHPALVPYCGIAVASLRVVTLWEADGPQPLYAVLKLPSKDAMVDGSGLVITNTHCAIELSSGRLVRGQYNDHMNDRSSDVAPATGLPVAGLELPDFAAGLQLACAAHRMFPPHGIVGTDVILSANGPLINEINPNPTHSLYQRSHDRGLMNPDFRPRLDEAARLVQARLAGPRQG